MDESTPASSRLPLTICAIAALGYCLSGNGHLQTTDMYSELAVARSMVQQGAFTVTPDVTNVRGLDGQAYSKYGMGASLLLVPSAALGGTASLPGGSSRTEFLASLLVALMAAASVALVFLIAADIGASPRAAVAMALVFAFATINWPYAHDAFDIGPTTTFLLLSLFGTLRAARSASWRWLLLGGAAAGAAVLMRVSSLIELPFLSGLLAWRLRSRGWPAIPAIAAWLGPVVAALALVGWYDWVRFGLPLETGYGLDVDPFVFTTPTVERLAGLVISPGKSLFLYSPPLLLGLLGLPALWRRDRGLAVALVGISVTTILLFSSAQFWSGDWAWGPRYMVPITPLVLLPAAFVLSGWGGLSRAARGGIIAVCLAGVLIQCLGVAIDFYHQMGIMDQDGIPLGTAFADPAQSAIWRHLGAVGDVFARVAEYPSRFAGWDLAHGRPTYTTWDFWWNYAALAGVDPRLVWGSVAGGLGLLGASTAALVAQLRVSHESHQAPGATATSPAPVA